MKTRCILSRAIALALTLTCTGGGYTSFAKDVPSDEFFKKEVIEVTDDTTVNPSPYPPLDSNGYLKEPDVKRYMVEGHTINVAKKDTNLVLNNLSMNNPVIQGKGNITLSVDEASLIRSKIKGKNGEYGNEHYGNSLLVLCQV